MIDTVRFKLEIRSKPSSSEVLLKLRRGWRKLPNCKDIRIRYLPNSKGHGGIADMVEASLPKLLHGHNVKLLDSQDAVNSAFQRLETALSKHFEISTPTTIFTRVDLCWNYRCDPAAFLLAHEALNHPAVNRRICSYRNRTKNTGLSWEGSKLRITFYDKTKAARKAKITPNSLIRVEIRLRGEILRGHLSESKTTPLTKLDINNCYRTFRSILLRFPPSKPVLILQGRDDLALAAWRKGIPIYEILGRTQSPRTISELRKRLGRRQPRSQKIDWNWMLPEQFPPRGTTQKPIVRKIRE